MVHQEIIICILMQSVADTCRPMSLTAVCLHFFVVATSCHINLHISTRKARANIMYLNALSNAQMKPLYGTTRWHR